MEAYTLANVKSQLEFAVWLREFKLGLCNNLGDLGRAGGGREIPEGGDICTIVIYVQYVHMYQCTMVNSCWCMTKINPILSSNHQSIKIYKYNKNN